MSLGGVLGSHLLVVGGLAVLAAMGTRWSRRPAVSHALWLLVLLKLVTPPLWWAPVLPSPKFLDQTRLTDSDSSTDSPESAGRSLSPHPGSPSPSRLPGEDETDGSSRFRVGEDELLETALPLPLANHAPTLERHDPSKPDPGMGERRMVWVRGLLALWVLGSLSVFTLTLTRGLRFRRLLRFASPPPPELQEEIAALAQTFKLRTIPPVAVLDAPTPPLVFCFGQRARLVLPLSLLRSLRRPQIRSLIGHELAHLRRRDHWVRSIEVLATVLFWWYPVTWWIRRSIREAEEECCDAWVLAVGSTEPRAYATALVETLDFLAEEGGPHLPPLANGFAQIHKLERRVTMIMQGKTSRSLSLVGKTLLALTAMGLPVLPTWANKSAAPIPEDPGPLPVSSSAPESPDPQKENAVLERLEKLGYLQPEEGEQLNSLGYLLPDAKPDSSGRARQAEVEEAVRRSGYILEKLAFRSDRGATTIVIQPRKNSGESSDSIVEFLDQLAQVGYKIQTLTKKEDGSFTIQLRQDSTRTNRSSLARRPKRSKTRDPYDPRINQIVRLWTLKHQPAEEFVHNYKNLLETLGSQLTIQPDVGRNSLVLTGPKAHVEEITHLLSLVDVPHRAPQQQRREDEKIDQLHTIVSDLQSQVLRLTAEVEDLRSEKSSNR